MSAINKRRVASMALLAGMLVASGAADARQFRSAMPIATPAQRAAALPPGARPVAVVEPLSRAQIEPLLEQVMQAWNTGQLEAQLGEGFYDSARLGDSVDRVVPRDARLRIQAVQGVQTLQQFIVPDGAGEKLVSIVSATVRTQLEFNDPAAGFQRRPGVNEYILKVTRPLP
jgi:hypothetical protein